MAVVRTSSPDNKWVYYGSKWRETFTFGAADTAFTCLSGHKIEGAMLKVWEPNLGVSLWPTLDYTVSTDGTNTLTLTAAFGVSGTLVIENVE